MKEKEDASSPRKARFWNSAHLKLYCYYGFSSWAEVLWMFAAGMAFGELGGNLQLTASSAFVASASILIFSPTLGKYIDQSNRLKAALVTLLCTKISIILTMGVLGSMLHFLSNTGRGGLMITLSIFCILTNMVATLATISLQVIIQKDWIVVLCRSEEDRLTTANTILLRIKLVSFLISPYVAGQIMVWTSVGIGCFVIALLTVVTLAVEGPLLYSVYRSVPPLSTKAADMAILDTPLLDRATATQVVTPDGQPESRGDKAQKGICNTIQKAAQEKLINPWKIYSQQKVLLAGISLALLYMTVLGLDSITDVYAFSQGLKANTVALVKGCGALSGVLGSFAYPRVTKRVGLLKTGMVALILEISCLVLPLISIGLPGSPFDLSVLTGGNSSSTSTNLTEAIKMDMERATGGDKTSIAVFLTGIVLSRIGLWMADLTFNQLFQETVDEAVRGSVGSVQNALNYLMDMIKNILVICLPEPETFGLLIIGSWIFVFTACVCYFVFSRRESLKLVIGDGEDGKDDKPKKMTVIE